MRALVVAWVIASAGAAAAQPWTEPDPAAVVGTWRGSVAWKQCAIDGAARVTLVVARDGSGYRLDLAPLADGLGSESFAPTGGPALEAHRADLHATWTGARPGRARLRLALGGGCVATAALRRATVGAAACDEMIALAAIARTCAALPEPTSPEVDGLVARLVGGRRAAGARRACAQAAAPLRAALVTAGCVPAPIERPRGPAVVECDALIATVMRAVRCDRIAVDVKQRFLDQVRIIARSAAVAEPIERAALIDSCRTTAAELDDLLPRLGC
ncbi:MAG: hypothetical protein IPL61_02920 [Myxococcales bacterium]|nr:hypothetical protein [Myxococcales bacterium]